jgi:phi LC3 family holin
MGCLNLKEAKMKINWKVRLKNKNFWLAMIPAFLVLVQVILRVFGVEIDIGEIGNRLIDVVNAAFVVLSILGITIDPTTKGISDSDQAMTYDKPKGGESTIEGK